MISNVSNTTQTQHAAQATQDNANVTKPKPKPKPTTENDTVKVSSAALAALQEATETTVQTAKEANAGDSQARRLLAKEAAEKPARK